MPKTNYERREGEGWGSWQPDLRIRNERYNRINEYLVETGISISSFFSKAADLYLDKVIKDKEEDLHWDKISKIHRLENDLSDHTGNANNDFIYDDLGPVSSRSDK